jgi:hypothetical protein
MDDGRALTDREVEAIQKRFYAGLQNDREVARLFQTIFVLRKVVRELLKLFVKEPFRRVHTAEPVLNSVLAHFKELAALEDKDKWET